MLIPKPIKTVIVQDQRSKLTVSDTTILHIEFVFRKVVKPSGAEWERKHRKLTWKH